MKYSGTRNISDLTKNKFEPEKRFQLRHLSLSISTVFIGLLFSFGCSKQDDSSVEAAAKDCFELFKANKSEELLNEYFCSQEEYWDYTFKSLGHPQDMDNEEKRQIIEELREEFQENLKMSIDKTRLQGEEEYGIEWKNLNNYNLEIRRGSRNIGKAVFEMMVPVISFYHEDQHLMWRFETFILNKNGEFKIYADRVELLPYAEQK